MAKAHPLPKASRFQDLTEKRFGRLVVVAYMGSIRGNSQWECQCDCGNTARVSTKGLTSSESTRSCGCLRLERATAANTKHGMARFGKVSSEYRIWRAMKDRCCNPNVKNYGRYGGRGITVCDRWRNSFEAFFQDMGPRPKGLTIERIDNDGNYEPTNCRWATVKEQSDNRSNSRMFTLNGRTMCLYDWARELGMSQPALRGRIETGWSIEKALTTPPNRTGESRFITHDGMTLSVAAWSRRTGIHQETIRNRLRKGWSTERILAASPMSGHGPHEASIT